MRFLTDEEIRLEFAVVDNELPEKKEFGMRNYNNMFNPIRFNIRDHTYLLRSIEFTKNYGEPSTTHIVAEEVDPSEPHFGSLFDIKKVIFNDPATIVLWKDGTKTVVKCQDEDVYDEQTGLLLCMAKKMYGNDGKFNDVLRKWMPEEEERTIFEAIEDILNTVKYNFKLVPDGMCRPRIECRWIPCSERLPEKDGMYFVSVDFLDRPTIGIFEGDEWLSHPDDKVLAWMPLPEIYKGE